MPTKTNAIYPVIASYGVAMIKKAGHEISFLDAPTQNVSIEDTISEATKYDIVIMEGRTAIITWIWEVASKIKELNPNVTVAVYGDHVIARPNESLEHGIDYVINCGDYDYGALKLVESLDYGLMTPRNFTCRLMNDLNNLPFIDRDLVPWKNYYETWRHKEKFGWFQSGRGCWAKCTFCSWVYNFYSHTIRVMSPRRIADEVMYASEKWGIEEYLDDADTFLTHWGVQFSEILLREEIKIYWNMQTRADEVLKGNIDDWEYMKDAGLHIVKLGVDGGSDTTLAMIQKGYNIECAERAVKLLRKAGVEVHVNMVLGWPWETKKEAYDVIRWVKKMNPNQAQFSVIQPFVGTPIFDQAIKNGWFAIEPYDWDSWNMKSPILKGEMSTDEIRKLHRDAWKNFYITPKFIIKQLAKSTALCFEERSFDSFRHIWRGYKGVKNGHMKAMECENT